MYTMSGYGLSALVVWLTICGLLSAHPFDNSTIAISEAVISASTTPSIDALSGWTFAGCYLDNVLNRTLEHNVQTGFGNNVTLESCLNACAIASYTICGTENGGECWGGDAITGEGQLTENGCSTVCNGNSDEICGGVNRLSMYEAKGTDEVTPTTPLPPSLSAPLMVTKTFSTLLTLTSSTTVSQQGSPTPPQASTLTASTAVSATPTPSDNNGPQAPKWVVGVVLAAGFIVGVILFWGLWCMANKIHHVNAPVPEIYHMDDLAPAGRDDNYSEAAQDQDPSDHLHDVGSTSTLANSAESFMHPRSPAPTPPIPANTSEEQTEPSHQISPELRQQLGMGGWI